MSAVAEFHRSPLDVLHVDEARAALARALAAPGPEPRVIVDFDETLWLRNSTEEYLRSLRPRFLAYILLQLVDLLRPWAFLRVADARRHYRDWIRTLVCTILMPWNLMLWRRAAAARALRWRNGTLLDWLAVPRHKSPILVATLGLDILVRPILSCIDPGAELIAAGSFWSGYRIRKAGKAAWIDRLRPRTVANAIVITDSEHDDDLLLAAATPILLKWKNAEYRPAFENSYVPFAYTQRAKRPGANYMLYGFLLEDVVLLWLALAWSMAYPLAGALGILLMHAGFFAIYELGYVENDIRAIRHEARPTTKPEAAAFYARVRPLPAWIAGLSLSLPGLLLVWYADPGSLTTSHLGTGATVSLAAATALWVAYLVFQRAAFWIYNRLDTGSRGMFYVVLQLVRLSGYAIILKIGLVGAVLLLSLVLARWVKYIAYRDTGRTLAESQRLLTLAFFVVVAGCLSATNPAAFLGFQAAVALLWLSAYAHQRVRQLARTAKLHLS